LVKRRFIVPDQFGPSVLVEGVQRLLTEGTDLSRTRVILKGLVGNQCWDHTWNTVTDFLNPLRAPDNTVQRH